MKTFTKSLLTFLLLFVAGTLSAQSLKVILEQDYSKLDAYPYYWMGDADNQPFFCSGTATVEIAEGALKIGNTQEQANNWDLQPFVLDWFNTTSGEDYTVRFWLKSDVDGTANLSIGTWSASDNVELSFTASDAYKVYTVNYSSTVTSTGNDEHILFQMGKVIGTVYIQKVQILQQGEDKPMLSEYGEWKSLINNSDMEGDDVSSYFTKLAQGDPSPSVITDGIGVNGSRAIMVAATAKVAEAWDNQFWFRFNEPVEAGTKYRVTFDYRADTEASVSTQAHAEPSDYIHYELFGTLNFTSDWQTYTNEAAVTSQQSTAEKKFRSAVFNLNEFADANNYYFDNINFEVFVPGIDAAYNESGIRILFPYYTNIVRLVSNGAEGKNRLMMPTDCFKVTVDGVEAPISTIEADITGAIMVFPEDDWSMANLNEGRKVKITFINPTDEKYRVLHIETNDGEPVENFEVEGYYNDGLDILPYFFGVPALLSSTPANNSFNLPNSIREFKLVFDKEVMCDKIEASIGNMKLSVSPATGLATEVTLTRAGSGNLDDGDYKLYVTKVYGKQNLGDFDFASFEISFSVGAKVSEELLAVIADAKTVKEENNLERYQGAAYTALVEAIDKYEAEATTYTTPNEVDAAILELNSKVKDVKNHRTMVDDYDTNINTALELVDLYADSKYSATEQYRQLKEVTSRYAGRVLINDDELAAANAELTPIVGLCKELFQEGASNCGDAGIKVLTDRIMQGAETLKALGASDSDPLIVAARDAMTDVDDIAEQLKKAITLKVYEKMKEPDNDLFAVTGTDSETGEEIKNRVNMSVFIKNPNIYALQAHNGYSPENVPGWAVTKGNAGLNTMWRHDLRQVEGLAEDVAFTTYHSEARMEQKIEDLPVGVYTVVLDAVDWDNGDNANGFCFAKTSLTPAVEEGAEESRDVNFAGTADIEHHGQYVGNHDNEIHNIEVLDGQLTLGVNFGSGAQWEFDRAKLFLTAPVASFNYVMAYESLMTSVENVKANQVRAIQLYDLNGRRVNKAGKGIVIIKKLMNDGSVKTEKVVR